MPQEKLWYCVDDKHSNPCWLDGCDECKVECDPKQRFFGTYEEAEEAIGDTLVDSDDE